MTYRKKQKKKQQKSQKKKHGRSKKKCTERPYDTLSHKSQVHEFLMLELQAQRVHQNTEYDNISDQKRGSHDILQKYENAEY